MKMCEQILKKKTAPQYNSNSLNCKKVAVTSYGRNKNHDDEIKKNQEKANNSPSYCCEAIKKQYWLLKLH